MLKVHSVEQKTQSSIKAVKKILETSNKTRKVNYTAYYPKASNDLVSKREYMQSDEFLHDPHNVEMFRISGWLMQARDAVGENVKASASGLKQAINGFSVIATELKKNPKLNFAKTPSHKTSADMRLYNAKIRLHSVASSVEK